MRPVILLSFALAGLAVPIDEVGKPSDNALLPTVRIANGTIIGTTVGLVESFKGIPFAEPPVGPLRLKPPQPLKYGFGTFVSQITPNSCPQFFSQVDQRNLPGSVLGLLANSPLLQVATQQSEDCLNLNVQRPAGATSSSRLPVVVWFFGGAFEFGSTQLYDATSLITNSIGQRQPVLYVAVNYRVAGFGFLAGKELQADGSTNLGLKDQRFALKWVQDNIEAFGGDPNKVTLWGESAGSISAFDHTIINGGDNSYNGGSLFRGVIMDSGAVIPTVPVDHPKAQLVYDSVVSTAGCPHGPASLACLRAVPYPVLLNAVTSVPAVFGYRSIDLAYLPRPDPSDNFFPVSPEVAIENGAFTKVPIIIGDQEDEGTLFSLSQLNITTTGQLVDYLWSFFPLATRKQVAGLVATYPENPAAGSPFDTGLLYEIYPQYKRLAAILGDVTFTLSRRLYLRTVASQVNSWSYLSSYLTGTPILGTFHISDVLEVYFDLPSVTAATSIQNYYISFINTLNPNNVPNILPWPKYDPTSKLLLNFQAAANLVIPDNFRERSYEYLAPVVSSLRI